MTIKQEKALQRANLRRMLEAICNKLNWLDESYIPNDQLADFRKAKLIINHITDTI